MSNDNGRGRYREIKDNKAMKTNNYCLVKSKVLNRITHETDIVWVKFTKNGRRVRPCELSRAEAREKIEAAGLVCVYKDKDGEVYDTPEGDFKKLFPSGLSNGQLKSLENNGY